MDMDTIRWFFQHAKQDKLCLLYNGFFSDDVTNKFIDLSEYNINSNAELSKMRKKVSFLMAECFQNIVRHGEQSINENNKLDSPGYFLTKSIDSTYFITSGNLIHKNNIPKLQKQLNQVNSLDKDELKELYRKVIDTEEFSSKGGAGLGLIEMARKSGKKIEFSFDDYTSDFSFFYNQITLENKLDDDSKEEIKFPIQDSIALHEKMNEEDILLIQKGDFSQESILPVLKIIEQNLGDNNQSNKNKEVYHVLVELLQNIGKHSLEIDHKHDGIFAIGKRESKFIITSGNYIEKEKADKFKQHLNLLTSKSKDELRKLYLQQLKNGMETENGGAGIGLIDLAKECEEPIQYQFDEVDQEKLFFSIQVTV